MADSVCIGISGDVCRRLVVKLLGALALGIASINMQTARGADDPSAQAPMPTVKVGDRWTYQQFNYRLSRKTGVLNLQVTHVGPNVIMVVGTRPGGESEYDSQWTPEWNLIAAEDSGVLSHSRDLLHFPLVIGEKHSNSYEVLARKGSSPARSRFEQEATVVGWEDIAVPAGNFKAIKVEVKGTYQRLDKHASGWTRWQIWYVPSVNRWVKWVFEDGSGSQQFSESGMELIEYHVDYGNDRTAAGKSGEPTQSGSASQMEKAESQSVAAAAPTQDPVNTSAMARAKQDIEGDPVKRPFVEVGDCWTYRKTSVSKEDKKSVGHFTSCVTYVDYSKDVIFAVSSSGRGDGTDHTYTTEWNRVADRHAIRSDTHFLKFPLHVGDIYSFEEDYQLLHSAEKKRKKKWDMKVVGWDDVTVPAGTFRAVRIEGIGISMSMDSLGRPKSLRNDQVVMWYVPEVNRDVKEIWAETSGTIVHELTQYRLNK